MLIEYKITIFTKHYSQLNNFDHENKNSKPLSGIFTYNHAFYGTGKNYR